MSSRRVVSYQDVDADAGPSTSKPNIKSAVVSSNAEAELETMDIYADFNSDFQQQPHEPDNDEDDSDDEVAPLPTGVKSSNSTERQGKLSISAKKRLKKKRKLARKHQNEQNDAAGGPTAPSHPVQQSPHHQVVTNAIQNANESVSPQTPVLNSNEADTSLMQADESGWVDDDGVFHPYDQEEAEDYYDEYYEDEDGDEDDDGSSFALNTNIMIPDIPAHFANASPQSRNPRIAVQSQEDAGAEDIPDDNGRILRDEEVSADNTIVDAWQAALGTLASTSTPAAQSALWNFSPLPGSANDKKMRQASNENREKRRLRKFVQDKERKNQKGIITAKDSEKSASQPQNVSTSKLTNGAGKNVPGSASGIKLNRAIPPSIGLQGNAAWQAACATVASTKNRIGPPVFLEQNKAESGSKQKDDTQQQSRSTPPLPSNNTTPVPPPDLALPSVSGLPDAESFHRICMSWYQAGYYTGLWQGREQGQGSTDG
ncbi:unnamed protein product [Sympodiomycopsis kandeliae]